MTRRRGGSAGARRRHASASTPAAAPSPSRGSWWVAAGIVAALVMLVFAIYARALRFDFVPLDDPNYVPNNPHVVTGLTWANVVWAFTSRWASYWIPVTWISYMAEVTLFGAGPAAPHATNIALHAANAALLFVWLRQTTGKDVRSAIVAALFAVHPLHVESVAWITERKDVLSTLFLLLALIAYSSGVRRGVRRIGAWVYVWFVLGVLAKPMLVTLPIVLLLADAWPLGRAPVDLRSVSARARWRSLALEKWPLFAVAVAASAVVYLTQDQGGAMVGTNVFPIGLRIENALVSVVMYLGQTVWPAGLTVLYTYPSAIPVWKVAAASVIVAGISWATWRTASVRPALAVGWLWFLITLLPVIGIVQVGLQPRADRFTYVPLIGIFTAVVWAAADALARRRKGQHAGAAGAVAVAVALAVVLALAVVASRQVSVWRDGVTLWTHAVEVLPPADAFQAEFELASALDHRGRTDDAIEHYDAAVREKPDFSGAQAALGAVLDRAGRTADAQRAYERALAIDSSMPEIQNNLGALLARSGQIAEALPHFEAAVSLAPAMESARVNLGVALAREGRRDDAIRQFQAALQLNPANAQARHLLDLLRGSGK